MKSKLTNKYTALFIQSRMKSYPVKLYTRTASFFVALSVVFVLVSSLFPPPLPLADGKAAAPFVSSIVPRVGATGVYANLSGGSLSLNLTPATVDLITTNDDWSGVASVEGYFGLNLTATHGIDPQTVLGTEFANNALPVTANTQVNANKGNPSAFNAGGVTEFDSGDYLAIGFQGNVQANPYVVFYLNTTGRSNITLSYTVTDIDNGNNNAVSPLALQYRIGETGNFINIPAGFIADATDGPNLAGRNTLKNVVLPADAANKPKVQVRLITTNAANAAGASTPDEWIGVNAIVVSSQQPTAASVTIGGRVFNPYGRPLAGANVFMYNNTGGIRTARTNPFGFYRFGEVAAGETYVFEVRSKRYVFSNPVQVLNVTEDYDSLNFFASPSPGIRLLR
jgi:hypothetical protein